MKKEKKVAAKLNLAEAQTAAQRFAALRAEQLRKIEGGVTADDDIAVATAVVRVARW